jgi:hypothetical protein
VRRGFLVCRREALTLVYSEPGQYTYPGAEAPSNGDVKMELGQHANA